MGVIISLLPLHIVLIAACDIHLLINSISEFFLVANLKVPTWHCHNTNTADQLLFNHQTTPYYFMYLLNFLSNN